MRYFFKTKNLFICALLFITAGLTACSSTENYEAQLDQWIGKSEKELLMGWGPPDKQYKLDNDTKMISYVKDRTDFYPGGTSACFGISSNNALINNCAGLPARTQTHYYCETIFTLVHDRVTRWGHKGNDCRS